MVDEMLIVIKKKRGDRIGFDELKDILDKVHKINYFENFQENRSAANLAIEVRYFLNIRIIFIFIA